MKKLIFKKSPTGKTKDASQEYMKTVERLIRILSTFDKNKNRTYSTTELAAEFGVTQRTIQRDLKILTSVSYPIIDKGRGQYAFDSNYSLRRAPLTKEQESLLSFMFEIATSLGGKFESAFRDLFKRLLAEDLYTPFFAKVTSSHMALPDSSVVRVLESAISEYSRVKVVYTKQDKSDKEYTLEPVKIAFYDGFWYLIVQNKTQDDVAKFRLDKIKSADILDETFVVSVEIDKMLSESVNIWFSTKRGEKVLIEIGAPVAEYFKDRVYFPKQKVVKEKKDGSIILETFPSHPDEIIHTVTHWMPHIRVLEPESFKKEVKGMVEEYVKSL